MDTLPQPCIDYKARLDEVVARLVDLTTREQAIYQTGAASPDDLNTLRDLTQERARLLDLKRALSARADLSCLPVDGYAVDLPGFVKPRDMAQKAARRRGRRSSRDLPRGVERMLSGRVRAVVYMPHSQKVSIATFDATPEQIAVAEQVVLAGYAARALGCAVDEVREVALARLDELVAPRAN